MEWVAYKITLVSRFQPRLMIYNINWELSMHLRIHSYNAAYQFDLLNQERLKPWRNIF